MAKPIVQVKFVKTTGTSVPSVCQFGVIVLWKRGRLTGKDSELPHHVCDAAGLIFAVSRVGSGPITPLTCDVATTAQRIALWKGGVIRHRVGVGLNISIEHAFRNLDKAQFLEALFGVADILY